MSMDFRKIIFGKADAQEEGVECPQLLLNGYYDNNNLVQQVCNTSKFLLLGYKGSGKSALSEHLKLSESNGKCIEQQSLKDFPYKLFSKIVSGDSELEYKLKVSWRWLLLVQMLNSLRNDKDANPKKSIDLDKLIDFLTQTGVYPLVNMSSLVTKTTSRTFQGSLKSFKLSQTTKTENAQISFEWIIEYVKKIVSNYAEMQQHFLIIDGLDDILTSREIQYLAIAALINEAKDLNLYFRRCNLPLKILILCRTDIFERLPDANKNKIRRDCSYSFTWYKEGEDTQKDCGLIDIINIRGRLVYPEVSDVIETFFPAKYLGNDTYSSLLEMTRHTPRDFLQLLVFIQEHCLTDHVDKKAIDEGIKAYSSDYFLPEIKDELVGYVPYDTIDLIVNILSSFRSREFSYQKFIEAFKALNFPENLNVDAILNVLYDCSAIGHAYPYKDGKETRVTFKYRNRNSSFNKSNRIILHKGLWKALNVNF